MKAKVSHIFREGNPRVDGLVKLKATQPKFYVKILVPPMTSLMD